MQGPGRTTLISQQVCYPPGPEAEGARFFPGPGGGLGRPNNRACALEHVLCDKKSHCNEKPSCSNEDKVQPKLISFLKQKSKKHTEQCKSDMSTDLIQVLDQKDRKYIGQAGF